MAYVPNCEHDVFISYSHLNNQPALDSEKGWVTYFKEALEKQLWATLGSKEVDIYIDYSNLNPGAKIEDSLMGAVKKSATMLIILSNAYLQSEWCSKERNQFLTFLADGPFKNEGAFGSIERLMVVPIGKVKNDEIPKEILSYKFFDNFYKEDEKGASHIYGYPIPERANPTFTAFYKGITSLAADAHSQLANLKKEAKNHNWVPEDDEKTNITKKYFGAPEVLDLPDPDLTIIIDSHLCDIQLVEKIKELVSEHDLGFWVINEETRVDENKKNVNNKKHLQQLVSVCGGILIIYRNPEYKEWVQERVKSLAKICAQRKRSMGKALINVPPKPLPDYWPPGIKNIRCYSEFQDESTIKNLNDFLEELKCLGVNP